MNVLLRKAAAAAETFSNCSYYEIDSKDTMFRWLIPQGVKMM